MTDLTKCDKSLEVVQQAGMPLLVHREVADAAIDLFDSARAINSWRNRKGGPGRSADSDR